MPCRIFNQAIQPLSNHLGPFNSVPSLFIGRAACSLSYHLSLSHTHPDSAIGLHRQRGAPSPLPWWDPRGGGLPPLSHDGIWQRRAPSPLPRQDPVVVGSLPSLTVACGLPLLRVPLACACSGRMQRRIELPRRESRSHVADRAPRRQCIRIKLPYSGGGGGA